MPFNSGYRAKRANDTQGIVGPQSQFLQKTFPKPYITGYAVSGSDDNALDPAGGQTVLINGGNFSTGVSAVVDGVQIGSVTLISSNQISFTTPAKASGSYTLIVYNPSSDSAAILVPGLIYSGVPTWTTAAGSIGTVYETTAINTSVVATSDSALTYAVTSGSIPTGATFYANGVMTGTAPVDSGSTTYTFAVTATDAELQDTTRTFTLTINTDVVSWSTPTPGSTITLDTSAYSTTLSATSAAGYNVSYTANALPDGLTLTGNTISGTATTEGSSSTLLTATSDTSNRSATNTISWIISFGDAYWSYVTTLLSPTLTTLPFNYDASTNNFAVTITGDTKPNNFNPYTPGYYSAYFDAKTDYISIPATTALTTFTGDFTFEAWIYPSDTSISYWSFWDSRQNGQTAQAMAIGISPLASPVTGQGRMSYFNGTNYYGTGIVYYNRWTHVAFVRSGSTMTFYIDGVASGTATISGTQTGTATTNPIWIGTKDNSLAGYGTTGYISNLRVVNGTAVYTGNFTPSTSPLTAITNTVLLACQSNRFIDNSTNNYTLTSSSTNISGFNPYTPNSSYSTYGSTYFDGTGDYLTVPANAALTLGTSDYTVEAWIYLTGTQTTTYGWGVIGTYPGSGTGWSITINRSVDSKGISWILGSSIVVSYSTAYIPVNTWTHIAVTRSGTGTNNTSIFLNGALVSQATDNTNDTFSGLTYIGGQGTGQLLTGYISNARVVKGTAVYTSAFTPPTEPLTAITNTSLLTCQTNQSANNNVFLDNSTNNLLITRNGNATQGTLSPYGANWSNYFDGTGDYLSVPSSTAITPGTGNFTLEFWFNNTHTTWAKAMDFTDAGAGGIAIYVGADSTLRIAPQNQSSTSLGALTTTNAPLNQWNHFAIIRSSGSIRAYVNGTPLQAAVAYTTSLGSFTKIGGTADGYILGYLSNFRYVSSAVYDITGSTISVPTTPLTAIASTGLLTCQSNRLIDNSPNNLTLTKNGDVSVQKFGPFAGTTLPTPYYSGYFDGTGDTLTIGSSVPNQFGSGDFTIETWYYCSGSIATSGQHLFFRRTTATAIGLIFQVDGSKLNLLAGDSITGAWEVSISSATTLVAGTWYHFAMSRSGSTWKIFVNGTLENTATASFTIAEESANITIGTSITGYLSNYRVVKGTAVYTSNFTPPTAPLTAISGTSLLTCQSSTFIDNSTNNFTITANGNSKPTNFSPFTVSYATKQSYTPGVYGGSMYFGATSAYGLVVMNGGDTFGTGDFTVELWLYPLNSAINLSFPNANTNTWGMLTYNNQLFWQENGGNLSGAGYGTVTQASWNHLAVCRSGSTIRWFVNGVQVNSASNTFNYSGAPTNRSMGPRDGGGAPGYISDFRVIKGQALYTSNFVPQNQPLTLVRNTTLLLSGTGGGIYDASEIVDYETVGDAKLANFSPYNGSYYSNYFDGTGDYLTLPNSSAFVFGTGSFTIEFWINAQLNNDKFILGGRAAIGSMHITTGGYNSTVGVLRYTNGTDAILSSGVVTDGNWHHCAIVRNGSSAVTLYVDGVSVGTGTDSTNYTTSVGTWYVASNDNFPGSNLFTGYLSNLRVVKGTALYTANFTPPTSPLTAVSGTSLLTCQSNKFVDNSTNNFTITRNGDVAVRTQNPWQNNTGTSVYFDGTGDYLTTPSINFQNFAFNTGNFTMEAWIYPTVFSGDKVIISSFATWATSVNFFFGTRAGTPNVLIFRAGDNVPITLVGNTGLNANEWAHVAVTRSSGTTRIFVNGIVQTATHSGTVNISGTVRPVMIGSDDAGAPAELFVGNISDLRVTKGVARYTSSFTPPIAPFNTK